MTERHQPAPIDTSVAILGLIGVVVGYLIGSTPLIAISFVVAVASLLWRSTR